MTTNTEKRRAGFEAWAKGFGFTLHRDTIGEYVSGSTETVWAAWNAALDSVSVDLPEAYEDNRGAMALYEDELLPVLDAAGIRYK